ncbi:MAG: RNase adapter RapZ [Proteobacteria bacterium]|nr:RNase adapter RapZ [Pseudomonadota bacterium]
MQIKVTFRNSEPRDEIKQHAEEKIEKIKKFMQSPVQVGFVLSSGYYCVDNLPIKLIEPYLDLYKKDDISGYSNIAIGVDIRSTLNFDNCRAIIEKLKTHGYEVKLLFITADKQIVLQRYQETRNAHPLTMMKNVKSKTSKKSISLEESVDLEFSLLEPLRRIADIVIDTTNTNVHELRQQIFSLFSIGNKESQHKLLLRIISFGFSKGIPTDVDLLLDVRFLPNPHFDINLRPLTGMDKPVKEFLESKKATVVFWERLSSLMDFLVPEYTKEGKSYLTIGVGCTGGRHRSVMIAEKIKEHFEAKGYRCIVEHRDIYLPHV